MSLTNDRNTPHKDGELLGFPAAAGVKIYSGALVAVNATGFATPGATSTTLTYAGRAEQYVDNTAGADGGKTVQVRRKRLFKWSNAAADPITQADVNKTCYIVDDQTIAKTNGGNTRSPAGRVLGIDPDGVWVE
ncbi:hypothetical protein ACO0LO_01810 [Undibacterium sp. TJN25]|uniref:hypothetical protein n=1 Tax=Undibacterium sp. TJN25 TaxID=3413056 RepID=UPI003BF306BA